MTCTSVNQLFRPTRHSPRTITLSFLGDIRPKPSLCLGHCEDWVPASTSADHSGFATACTLGQPSGLWCCASSCSLISAAFSGSYHSVLPACSGAGTVPGSIDASMSGAPGRTIGSS